MKIPRSVGIAGAVNLQTEMVCERLNSLIEAQRETNCLLAQLLEALRTSASPSRAPRTPARPARAPWAGPLAFINSVSHNVAGYEPRYAREATAAPLHVVHSARWWCLAKLRAAVQPASECPGRGRSGARVDSSGSSCPCCRFQCAGALRFTYAQTGARGPYGIQAGQAVPVMESYDRIVAASCVCPCAPSTFPAARLPWSGMAASYPVQLNEGDSSPGGLPWSATYRGLHRKDLAGNFQPQRASGLTTKHTFGISLGFSAASAIRELARPFALFPIVCHISVHVRPPPAPHANRQKNTRAIAWTRHASPTITFPMNTSNAQNRTSHFPKRR